MPTHSLAWHPYLTLGTYCCHPFLLQDPAGWSAYPVVVQRSSGGGHHAARSTQPWWRAAHRRSPPVLGSGRTPLTTTGGASAPRFQPGYRGAKWEPAGERSEAGHTFLPPRPHLSAESRQPILPSVPTFYWGDSWSKKLLMDSDEEG